MKFPDYATLSESYRHRFGGIARLYGQEALVALSKAHFVVIGMGGVGTWAAEALVRSGIGELTIVELDDICTTNSNRQLHAMASTVGRPKNSIMEKRLHDINPELNLHVIHDFLSPKNLPDIINKTQHVVIDAMDSANVKASLVAYCSAIKVRLITVGSSGGKQDPRLVTTGDLGRTISDPLLAKIRSQLYRFHNFSRDKGRKFRIDAVFSSEQMRYPQSDGRVCMDKKGLSTGVKLDCAGGFGSSTMVTGSFGFTAAAQGIERYLQKHQLIAHKD